MCVGVCICIDQGLSRVYGIQVRIAWAYMYGWQTIRAYMYVCVCLCVAGSDQTPTH
jgi:hypothetical protein